MHTNRANRKTSGKAKISRNKRNLNDKMYFNEMDSGGHVDGTSSERQELVVLHLWVQLSDNGIYSRGSR
jgi:hypothetical protein